LPTAAIIFRLERSLAKAFGTATDALREFRFAPASGKES
jgi:hypothetical protein